MRLTWKDELPSLAAYYYATPLVLIWNGFAVAGLLFFARRKTRLSIVTGLAAILCWAWWQQDLPAGVEKIHPPESFQVVFWNTARLKAGWAGIAKRIHQVDSPVMGFVEAGPDEDHDRTRWQFEFPSHQPVFFGNGMVLLVRGEVKRTESGRLAMRCYYGLAEVEVNGKPLTVLLVDLFSNPFYPREKAFGALSEVIERSTDGPLLVLGDFNTPADSVHFERLRKRLSNAYELAGDGHAETWPAPYPVLAIDQVWVNPALKVHQARSVWSVESDHRAVLVEMAVSEK